MTYEDLLLVPYKHGGRDNNGMDCYGLVLECLKRTGVYLKDISYHNHNPRENLTKFVSRLNVIEVDLPLGGQVLQCDYDNELHIGYILDKKRVLHMTTSGARVSPISILQNAKFYEVINEDN